MIELRPYQKKALQEMFDALRKSDAPVLLECSVGGGKSYLIGSLVKTFDDQNKRVLCLVNSSELVRNNSQAFKELGGSPAIFCASLNLKEYNKNIIFATPQSIINAIKQNHPISKIIFNMLVIDEAHGINYHSETSIFMQILRHYKQAYAPMRTLGLTGTAFRGSTSITGTHALFKTQVGNISTQYLIEHGFLVPPLFGLTKTEGFDFSKCKVKNTGEFSGKDLQNVIDSKKRLTWQILQEVQNIMEHRDVCMVFCSTIPHCHEAMAALPEGEARMIIGETDDPARHEALSLARNKEIKYLVSVACLLTGVNVPAINVICWLRPTASLLLYIQGIGRGLRLSGGKTDCLVLDFAGNTSRFQDIDDPIINQALQPREENEQDYVIPCLSCGTSNTVHARRCIGIQESKRCLHYFEWKDCHACQERNDQCSRYCRRCHAELIDPNAKLSLKAASQERFNFDVLKGHYWIQESLRGPVFHAKYETKQGLHLYEQFSTKDDQCCNIFYGKFIRHQVKNASRYYPCLNKLDRLQYMLKSGDIMTPHQLVCIDKNNKYVIQKRVFLNETIAS